MGTTYEEQMNRALRPVAPPRVIEGVYTDDQHRRLLDVAKQHGPWPTIQAHHFKTVEELIDIYCSSVGRNSVLLLNFAPDRRGLIPDVDAKRAAGLQNWISKTFGKNLLRGAKITALNPRGPAYEPTNLVDSREKTYYASADDALTDEITSPLFDVPSTIAMFGSSLYAINARFTTPPTPTTSYTVAKVPRG